MPLVVPVKFPYASHDLWFDPKGLDIVAADYAIVSTERGTEIGLVTADPFEAPAEELGGRELKPVLRVASERDLQLADDLARQADDAMPVFRDMVKESGLEMKPVGVEYLFGGERAVFYFAAEDRVDFRDLVKKLSSEFHIRVDMRQIGVRDETRLIGGYAHCGQELCCARFSGNFEPVSIRMAKEQDLPLNSSKISGVCGRLMCCLRYEFEAYKDFKSRAPKKKTIIETPLGKARIQEYNTPREQLLLRLENGKSFRVNLSDMSCTDEAQERAKQQGCACRPNCVTRDILEKIDSAEMRLALMELDREAGIDVGDGLSKDDRLVPSGPARSKRSGKGGQRGQGQGQQQAAGESAEGGRRRRRQRSTGAAPAQEQQRQAAPQAQEQPRGGGMKPTRRRRRHSAGEAAPEANVAAAAPSSTPEAPKAEDAGSSTRTRRRRHQQASGQQKQAQQKPSTPSVADQLNDGKVKVTRRRRPGDGGGQQKQAAGNAQQQAPHQQQNAGNAQQAQGDEAAPKRRRRRRSHKPRGEGGNQGGQAE